MIVLVVVAAVIVILLSGSRSSSSSIGISTSSRTSSTEGGNFTIQGWLVGALINYLAGWKGRKSWLAGGLVGLLIFNLSVGSSIGLLALRSAGKSAAQSMGKH